MTFRLSVAANVLPPTTPAEVAAATETRKSRRVTVSSMISSKVLGFVLEGAHPAGLYTCEEVTSRQFPGGLTLERLQERLA